MIQFRPMPWATVFVAAGCVLLVLLGNWQLRRLAWKEDLIAAVSARSQGQALPLAQALVRNPEEIEYQRTFAEGRFRHDAETYVFSQVGDKRVGFQVVTPLDLTGGGTILVDRGFVPADRRDPATRPAGQIEGEVRVTGLLRRSQPPGPFTPAPETINRIWYTRDVTALAGAAGAPSAPPVLLASDVTPIPGGLPEGGHTRLTFANDHLSYALTWYALAATLVGVYLAYHWQAGRLLIGRRQAP